MNIVLLHGWGFQSNIWQQFIPHLNQQFRITALDLLGFGKTTLPKETISLDLMTKHILENAPESAAFIGWSLGGLVAMDIAIHYPQRITHLITFASTPKFVATDDWPGMSSHLLNQFYQSLKMDYQATLQQFTLLQFYGSDTDRSVIKSVKQLVSNSPPSKRALNEGLDILKKTDLRTNLAKIQCPQQYIYGQCDTLVPPEVAEKIKPLANNAQVDMLPNVSHAPFLSNPELCAQHIEAFLK